jgi:hypothetical protein
MRARENHDDRRTSVRQAVLFGISWAIITITLNLLFTDHPVWIVIVAWSLMAVPVATLWWWLSNGSFAAKRRMSRRR